MAFGRLSFRRPSRRVLALLALAGTVVLAAVAGWRLFGELEVLRNAPRDNVQWTLGQQEVDLLKFENALRRAREGEAGLSEVRRAFDLFYSRAETLRRGSVFAELRTLPEVETRLVELDDFLQGAVPLIDGSDDELRAALPGLLDQVGAAHDSVRALALEGVRLYAVAADTQRDRFVDALIMAVRVVLVLVVILAAMLVWVERQSRLATERAIESDRSRRRLASTIGASLDAIVVADAADRILDWNGAAEEVFGYSREAAIGQSMAEKIMPVRYRAAHRRGMERILATGEKRHVDAGRIELSALRADGTEFPVELAIGMSEGEGGPIFISYLRDISARRRAERDLTKARDDAMAADRAKSEFLAVMSHEMRTPLNGVLGVLDLLHQTDLDARQRRYVEVATASGEILLRHINDVLDITRVEAGEMTFAAEPIELAGVLAETVAVSLPLAEVAGNTIDLSVDPRLGTLQGDAHRIRQVLLNLLGNATKFTTDGRILLEARLLREKGDGVEVEVAVNDSGPGVPVAERDRIFEDFVTLDTAYDRTAAGSGLGLAISRRIVQAMGGQIGVEASALGGARFWMRLPLARAIHGADDAAALSPSASERHGRLAVLVVEDNEVNRMVVREALRRAGHRVVEASEGRQGVELAAAERFDLILMDVSMPVMDGLEATRAIRQSGGASAGTPIVGLTAHALPDEQRRFAEAGMQSCLVKPVRREMLLRALAEQAGPGTTSPEPDAQAEDDEALIEEEALSDLAAGLPPKMLGDMIRRVRGELSDGLVTLRGLLADGKADEAASLTHRLAGSAAIVGAASVRSTLAEIEARVRQGHPDEATALLEALEGRIFRTDRVLAEFAET